MNWYSPLLTYRCGACGTTVTGLMSHTYVVKVEAAHAAVCKGFPPCNHEDGEPAPEQIVRAKEAAAA